MRRWVTEGCLVCVELNLCYLAPAAVARSPTAAAPLQAELGSDLMCSHRIVNTGLRASPVRRPTHSLVATTSVDPDDLATILKTSPNIERSNTAPDAALGSMIQS